MADISDHDLVRGIADRVMNSRQDYQSASEGDFSLAEVASLIGDSEALIIFYRMLENRLALRDKEIEALNKECGEHVATVGRMNTINQRMAEKSTALERAANEEAAYLRKGLEAIEGAQCPRGPESECSGVCCDIVREYLEPFIPSTT